MKQTKFRHKTMIRIPLSLNLTLNPKRRKQESGGKSDEKPPLHMSYKNRTKSGTIFNHQLRLFLFLVFVFSLCTCVLEVV
jgi:hypothetical protein